MSLHVASKDANIHHNYLWGPSGLARIPYLVFLPQSAPFPSLLFFTCQSSILTVSSTHVDQLPAKHQRTHVRGRGCVLDLTCAHLSPLHSQFTERRNNTNLSRSVSLIHYQCSNPAHLQCDQPPIRNPSSPGCV